MAVDQLRGHLNRAVNSQLAARCAEKLGVGDGTRTRDDWNHNPGLYQLSYTHHKNFLFPARHFIADWRARQDSNLQPPA